MEAIVLAGGLGTRLRSVVSDVPKPMAPISGVPFLEILFAFLVKNGFSRIVLSVGFLSEKIIGYFGGFYNGLSIEYVVEDHPLGTGGGIRLAMSKCYSDHVFVFNGDSFIDLKVADVELFWKKSHSPIIVAREVPDTYRFGRLECLGERVVGFSEKGKSGRGLINAGCYVLPVGCLSDFGDGEPFSIENDYLIKNLSEIPVGVFVTDGFFIDIGVPEDYERAQVDLLKYL